MVIVIAGVAGSGKSTIGALLAARTGWPFLDADAFHTPEARAKMAAGIPLGDEDRRGWLTALNGVLRAASRRGEHRILACSALTGQHRSLLLKGVPDPVLVWLEGEPALLRARIASRAHHFFPSRLLTSQLELAERPPDALVLDVAASPDAIVAAILAAVQARTAPRRR